MRNHPIQGVDEKDNKARVEKSDWETVVYSFTMRQVISSDRAVDKGAGRKPRLAHDNDLFH